MVGVLRRYRRVPAWRLFDSSVPQCRRNREWCPSDFKRCAGPHVSSVGMGLMGSSIPRSPDSECHTPCIGIHIYSFDYPLECCDTKQPSIAYIQLFSAFFFYPMSPNLILLSIIAGSPTFHFVPEANPVHRKIPRHTCWSLHSLDSTRAHPRTSNVSVRW